MVLTLALCFTSLVAWRAYERAVGPLIMTSRPGPTQLAISDRTAVLRSLWGDESGMIEVRGAVTRPGSFQTSLESPLGLARLVELAGGATEGARFAAVKRPDLDVEYFVSLKNAARRPDETQLMPEPGSVVDIR